MTLTQSRILIIGPEDTPYENGLFEFDLFCPAEYPRVPPKVWFKGTYGGIVDTNPNLHADGKGESATLPVNEYISEFVA